MTRSGSVALATRPQPRDSSPIETLKARHDQLQRNAFPNRSDPGLHPLVCGSPAELPGHRGNDGGARRIGRPFLDPPVL